MSEPNHCPQCGVEVPEDAPQGLCPNCVLRAGFATGGESQTGAAFASTASEAPIPLLAPAELAPYFPDLEILELVGHGGMGVVYKARQKHLDRLVALKILSPKIGRDPAFTERFAREARAMAMLSHPHIVAVHDFGQTRNPTCSSEEEAEGEDALYYFVMEFVDGVNLRQLLESGKLSPPEALAIVPQLCDALQYAHDHGVVHRDIKPENVLLDSEGCVKIADFGLAKLIGRSAKDLTLTDAGHVMGTPHYMAPEQIEHPQEVDHRADIYSLGVVFYQMLTGELPIGRFAPPSRKAQIDVRLDEVVLRALEKEPERRYQQASQVKTQVETIAAAPLAASSPPVCPAAGDEAIADARQQVRGPAIGLLVVGILNWLAIPLAVSVFLWWSLRGIPQPLGHPSVEPDVVPLSLAIVTVALVPMLLSTLIIVASVKMKRLRAYWLAITGSVLSIVSPAALIGLPVGIWALVVLSQTDVRRAFGQKRRQESDTPSTAAAGGRKRIAVAACVVFVVALAIASLVLIEADGIVTGTTADHHLSTGVFFWLFLLIALVALELIFGIISWKSSAGKVAVIVSVPVLMILLTLLVAGVIHESQMIHSDFGGWPDVTPLRPKETAVNGPIGLQTVGETTTPSKEGPKALPKHFTPATREKDTNRLESPLSGDVQPNEQAPIAQSAAEQAPRELRKVSGPADGTSSKPTVDSMRNLAERIAQGDQAAFDQLRETAKLLYRDIDYNKEGPRAESNRVLIQAAFNVLGDRAAHGNQAAFGALQQALESTELHGFVPEALGIAAAAGHAEAVETLLHHDQNGILLSSAVFALQAPAAKNNNKVVDFLVSILDNAAHRPLWQAAAQGLTAASARGNPKATAALKAYEETEATHK